MARILITLIIALLPLLASAQSQSPDVNKFEIKIDKPVDGKLVVKAGAKDFVTYDFETHAKPIFYPVLGPRQLQMTRGFPMDRQPNEATDHPHHKSIWTGHIINGVDFWTEKDGKIKHQKFTNRTKDNFTVLNHWIKNGEDKPMLSDETTYRFGADEDTRWLDAKIKFIASHGDFTFDDTKEGLFAIRTHPGFRITPAKESKLRPGKGWNSAGDKGKSIWGKHAKWVAFGGAVTKKETQHLAHILFFDHPDNFRHPTTWHARDYGLVAANPFGQHYFDKKPKGSGAHTIKSGASITFRYRIVFSTGTQPNEPTNPWAEINRMHDAFSKSKN